MSLKYLNGAALSLLTLLLLMSGTMAQDIFAYPNEGQSKEQQEQDEFQCYKWAQDEAGFDPMAAPQASAPPPQEQSTGPGLLGGAAVGAGVGAIGGAIGGDTGKGAAIGAVAGGVLGGLRSKRRSNQNQASRQQWGQQQSQQYANARNNYNRAYAACMQARGYTVN